MTEKIDEYERLHLRRNKLDKIIGHIQLLLSTIGNSDICPFCRSKIDVNALKKEYNRRKKEFNKLSPDVQYLNVE